jgi:hypothetical protein
MSAVSPTAVATDAAAASATDNFRILILISPLVSDCLALGGECGELRTRIVDREDNFRNSRLSIISFR